MDSSASAIFGLQGKDAWQLLFEKGVLDSLLKHGESWANSFTTNGYWVCIPYHKKRSAAAAPPAEQGPSSSDQSLLSAQRRIACDSGATWICMTRELVRSPLTGKLKESFVGLSRAEWRGRRGDDQRLALASLWTAHLRRPGGDFEQLAQVTRKCSSLQDSEAFIAACLNTHPAILDQKLRAKWANMAFNTWSLGKAILHGFWARLCAGSLANGTAGIAPVFLYGAASFAATGKGRRSAPTTAMYKALLDIAHRPGQVILVSEHRSSACCPACWQKLDEVWAVRPERVYREAAARAAAPLPHGWHRPPARAIAPWAKIRGKQVCGNEACSEPAFRFMHRDKHSPRAMEENALLMASTGAGVPAMQRIRHGDLPVEQFTQWPPWPRDPALWGQALEAAALRSSAAPRPVLPRQPLQQQWAAGIT